MPRNTLRNKKPRNVSSPRRSAFTLIEVLLVLIILVIISSIVAPKLFGVKEGADIDATKAQIGALDTSFDMYRLRMNKYPSKLEDLWQEPSDAKLRDKWDGPYAEEIGEDVWGNPFQYVAEGKKNTGKYDFWSNGPDGQSGTDDDIGNWKKAE